MRRTCHTNTENLEKAVSAIFLSFLISISAFLPQAKAQSSFSFTDLAQQLKTPEALEKYMKNNLIYRSDRSIFGQDDYWQTPQEMFERGTGDCEDFALFAQAVLQQNGYTAFLLSVYWNEDAHTVAVFEKDGQWGIFNLDKLKYTGASTMEGLGKAVRKHWSYLGIMRQEGNLGIISRKFKDAMPQESIISALPVTTSVPGPYVYQPTTTISSQEFYSQLASQKPQALHQAL